MKNLDGQEKRNTTVKKADVERKINETKPGNNFKGNKGNFKGDLLEFRIKRLLFAMGYFPQRGIDLRIGEEGSGEKLTDLDVYGIYFHKNFSSTTIWADCKSGEAKVLERISWLYGIKNSINVNDVIFVKKNIRFDILKFARTKGIQIFDLDTIKKLEDDYNILEDDWRGSWDYKILSKQKEILKGIDAPNQGMFNKIERFISCSYWTMDDFVKVKKSITALKQLAEAEKYPFDGQEHIAIKWAIYEIINLFLVAILSISKQIYYLSDRDKEEIIKEGLISGAISYNKRQEIVEATYKVAYSIMKKQIPSFNQEIEFPNLAIRQPNYYEALKNLLLRITNRPLDYFDLLRFLDFIFMEYDLKDKEIDVDLIKTMFSNYESLKIGAKSILYFICDVADVDKSIFHLLN